MDQRGGDNQLVRQRLAQRTLDPRMGVEKVCHRDASHSMPVLNRSPLICLHRSSQSPPDSIDSRTDQCLGHRACMKSIRSWFYAAALLACLLGIVLTTYKPTTDLGA